MWKRYIDDVFSLWNISIDEINGFIEQANRYHPTIKFTAEISDKETISPPATHQGSVKVSSKAKHLGCSVQNYL